MKKTLLKALILASLMTTASLAAVLGTPTRMLSKESPIGDLDAAIPQQFGEWVTDSKSVGGVVNPQLDAVLQSIYSQTVTRTYVRKTDGYRIMLSVAYGGDQSRELQVHRPEVCYVAQGFQLKSAVKRDLGVADRKISLPVMNIVAAQDRRIEPITYWVRIGDKVVRGNLEQGFARLSYGLKGIVPDGLLFRISSIDANQNDAFQMQADFINSLLTSADEDALTKLIGHQRAPAR